MSKKFNFLLLMSFLLMGSIGYSQQSRTVTGVVKDSSGVPIPGVSFQVKGSKVSGVTDQNGFFKVTVSEANPQLEFSSVGYVTRTVPVTGNNVVSVTLNSNASELSEVVVTGFGIKQQTRKLAYSVQEVKGEDLSRANTPNIVNALQGKVAGVQINQGAGGPSSSSRIRIRGNASVSRNNTQPLFVVDGVLIKPGVSGADSWGDNRDFGNELKNLNADDYESVTILKGSAATALYGSDALFGVVLIQTKKGKERKGLGVSVSQSANFEKAYKGPDVQNVFGGGYDPFFVKGPDSMREVEGSLGPYYSFGPKFDGQPVRDRDGRIIPWKANDVLDIYKTGAYYNTNVAVDGGSERTTFRFSYTNSRNNSVLPNNSFSRNVFSLRATQKVSNFINLDASISYANSDSKNPIIQGGNNSPLFRVLYSNARHYDIPYYKSHYIDTVRGGMTGATGNPTSNPYARASMAGMWWNIFENRFTQEEDNLRANLDLNVNILPWLNLLVRGNVNSTATNKEDKVRGQGPDFGGSNGSYVLYQNNFKTGRLQGLLTANKKFLNEDLETSLTVGGETYRGLGGFESRINTKDGLKIPDQYAISNSVNPIEATGREFPVSRLDAVYAYGDATWKDQLTLNFSARNDWNSLLTYPNGSGDYGYFYPSVGLAWVFTETFKNNKTFDALSFGKLRASLGYSGAGPDAIYATSNGVGYALLDNFTTIDGIIPRYGFPNNLLGNPALKPERSREFEVGADLRFFNNRLGIDLAWYKKNTFNQIIELTTPAESGVTSRLINAGNIQNKGIEIMLSGTPVNGKNFQWNTSFNFSRNRNVVIDLTPGVKSKDLDLAFGADVRSIAAVGKEYGTIISGYAFAYYQAKDGNGNNIANPSNGKKLLQQNGLYYRSQDIGQGQRELGSMMEKFLLSNLHTFTYKGVSLNLQVDSKVGGLMTSATHQYGSQFGSFESTLFGRDTEHGGVAYVDSDNRNRTDGIIPDGVFADGTTINNVNVGGKTYQEAVDAGLVKPLAAADYYDGIASWGTGIREYSIFENTWVVLREVSVGYTIPASISSKIKLNNLRVNVVGRNLFYLYNSAKDNINPEGIFSSRAGAFAEYGGLPFIRMMGVSLNAAF